jgi:uncharacterized protein YoxC
MVREPTPVETFFERLTSWVGSIPSLIMHTLAFMAAFGTAVFGLESWDRVLLIVTTIVSLEAIYLAIFIQMTVNRQSRELHDVSEEVEDISEDLEEIQEDVEEISEDVEEISKDVEEISEDVEEMNEDWDLETGKTRPPETRAELEEQIKQLQAKLEKLTSATNGTTL